MTLNSTEKNILPNCERTLSEPWADRGQILGWPWVDSVWTVYGPWADCERTVSVYTERIVIWFRWAVWIYGSVKIHTDPPYLISYNTTWIYVWWKMRTWRQQWWRTQVFHLGPKWNFRGNWFSRNSNLNKLNIIHSVHFLFYVYCPTNVHIYSLLFVWHSATCFETYTVFIFRDFNVLNYTDCLHQ
jgi:hypothetical protein